MPNLIEMTAMGHAAREPVHETSRNGKPYIRFDIAINPPTSQPEKKTQWVSVMAFGKANIAQAEKIRKGVPVLVAGTPHASAYKSKRTGEAVPSLGVFAYRVLPINWKNAPRDEESYAAPESPRSNTGQNYEDLPF